mgnify:CR=1 FL=1
MNETQGPALGAQVLPFDKGRWGHSTNHRTATALSGSAVKDKIDCGRREHGISKTSTGRRAVRTGTKKAGRAKGHQIGQALGQYVDKRKFKAKAAALEKAEERIQALEKALKDCQARSIQAELVCAAADLLQRAVEGLKTQQA